MATATYAAITRADLAGWDAKCIDLVLEAQELGWTGKVSSKGHAIMRAPDGEATFSVSRRWTNGRAGMNMRANLERWKRQQEARPDFSAFDQVTEGLEREQFVARLKAALSQITGDIEGELADVMSAVYDVVLDRPDVAAFAFQCAKEQRISQFGWLAAYPDDAATVRVWNVNWAVFDRRDGRVIDLGGPRTTEQGNEWSREFVEVSVAERLAWERRQAEVPTVTVTADGDEDRPYVCDECGRTFLKPHNLGRHKATIHKVLAFEPDPMDDGLDDLMGDDLTSSEPVVVQMDKHLTIVADRHAEYADPEDEPLEHMPIDANLASNAMIQAMQELGIVAQRMAFLENQRDDYDTRLEQIRREFEDSLKERDEMIFTLTTERDNARESLAALKQIVSDL